MDGLVSEPVTARGLCAVMVNLSKIRGCVYHPFATHLSLNNLAKHQKEREEER
jgi:hypothetical protein